MNSAFQVYVDYIMLKLHFIDKKFIWNETAIYDKISGESLLYRNDEYFFYSYYNDFKDRRDSVDFLISCFLLNNKFWIGDFKKEEYLKNHQSRISRYGALERTFIDDCEKIEEYLVDNSMCLENVLLTKGIEPPILMKFYPSMISLETLSLLEYLTEFTRVWFPLNILQKWRRLIIYKYSKILRIEERNMQKIQNAYQNLVLI